MANLDRANRAGEGAGGTGKPGGAAPDSTDQPTTGLTGGAEVTGPGADAGVTDGTRATATRANLGETEAVGDETSGGGPSGR